MIYFLPFESQSSKDERDHKMVDVKEWAMSSLT